MVLIIYLYITLPESKWQTSAIAAKAVSMSSTEHGSGTAWEASSVTRPGLHWAELLKPENGGPGESPGRAEAIERAKARSQERAAAKLVKKKKK